MMNAFLRLGLTPLVIAMLSSSGSASAQTNEGTASVPHTNAAANGYDPVAAARAEQLRDLCIQGRRCVCGRVLEVFTNGVVVDSGYADLQRPELRGNWHLPSAITASRDPRQTEDQTPGSLCVGKVFLTDLPHKRRSKVKINLYDYVVIEGYPAGLFTYTSSGNLPHTVRQFACGLETAVKLRLESESHSK